MIQTLALLLQESAVKLTCWPSCALFFFFNLDFAFFLGRRKKEKKIKFPNQQQQVLPKWYFFLSVLISRGE